MPSVDPFTMTGRLAGDVLQIIIARLETRATHPRFAAMLEDYLDAMHIDRARSVLDIGCGTGVAARAVARRNAGRPLRDPQPALTAQITAVDLSPMLVTAASRFAAAEGLATRITFLAADTRSLPFPDATFDAVIAYTLLSHVDDPLPVLQEAARVLVPGGTLGIFDGDYASLTFGHASAARGKAIDDTLISTVVNNPRVMRQLPRLLPMAGLQLVAATPYLLAEIGRAAFWLSAIEMFQGLIPRSGAMTRAEIDDWADTLRRDSAEGTFFAASSFYTYIAKHSPAAGNAPAEPPTFP